ncbi:MAG TPA: hypothetical protein VG347_04045 [Verrucomicrobiae bacterium]|nr:hypothetical protein [Verrucomicrobiae bacterium]
MGAASRAAELAWDTSCPLLVFPCLFEDLVQAAREQFYETGQMGVVEPEAMISLALLPLAETHVSPAY